MSDAKTLNRIETRLRKKKRVSDRERRLLAESYHAFGVPTPKDIRRML
jgi:hypothetical protein